MRSIRWRVRVPSAWRAPETAATRKHHHATDPQNTPDTVVNATLVEQENNEAMRRMTEFNITQNDQVKKVSSWAAILFPPTLVGTIYGMNFEYMPELTTRYGYFVVVGVIALICALLYRQFRKVGWL